MKHRTISKTIIDIIHKFFNAIQFECDAQVSSIITSRTDIGMISGDIPGTIVSNIRDRFLRRNLND